MGHRGDPRVCAVLLAIVLVQIGRMSKEAALARVTLQRERLAVAETEHLVATIDAADAYRYSLLLDMPNRPALAVALNRALDTVDDDFRYGDAAVLGVSKKWSDVHAAWRKALRAQPGPRAYEATSPAVGALANFPSTMQDASNLTYDPNVLAQNIANTYIQETPYAIMASARLNMLVDLSAKNGGMTLARRLFLASSVNNVRAGSDVSTDDLPHLASVLTGLMPERRVQWDQLPLLASDLSTTGTRFADLVAKHALLEPAGPTPP